MPTYRLHYFPESGNSYKLALMLTLCGQTFEPVWTDFGGGITRTAEWRRTVNEMGEIPVLEEDGVRLTQTAPILLKLAGNSASSAARPNRSNSNCCAGCSGTTTSSPATWRPTASCGRSSRHGDPAVLKYFRKRLDDFLGILETHLQRNAFAIGARPTIADISMMAYLHYPSDETGYDFAVSHPAISAWLGRMAALPGWKSAYDLLPGKRLTHYAK